MPKGGGSGGGGGGGRGGGGRSGGSSGGRGSSVGVGRGGSGGTGHSSIGYLTSTQGRRANYFSEGGGKPFILPSSYPFPGRAMGGGTRGAIAGTRTYGSGYTYRSNQGSWYSVARQPFPFGFWPIFWPGHGYSDEYGANATIAAQRPGGDQVIVHLVLDPKKGNYNLSNVNGVNESYWMIGDRDSTDTLLSLLIDAQGTTAYGCGVSSNAIQLFNSTVYLTNSTVPNSTSTTNANSTTSVLFENVIQWYRASSFVLAFTGYNNTFAFPPLNETAGLGWNSSSPLRDAQLYSPWLHCINNTIVAALPILDPKSGLSDGAVAGITIAVIFGTMILSVVAIWMWLVVRQKRWLHKQRTTSTDYHYNMPLLPSGHQ
ncbi:hypothetical protein FRC17_003333 [Serendipita sp. 399]|nr:hypothetical protein FRC17_003333 [Serendipita sp. 399]